MIESGSTMDRPVAARGRRARRLGLVAALVALVAVAAVWLAPRAASWLATERSVDASRLRIGTVTRGDLVRDVSVQGRIVAAFHPTAFSPTAGIVELATRAGETVEAGAVLARVDSPELESRLQRERSALASLESALDRRRIEARQQKLTDAQAVDLAALARDTARRAMRRAEESRAEGLINDVEYETAEDDLRRAELELRHAEEQARLEAETLDFEVADAARDIERQRLTVADLERQVDELTIRAPVAGLVSRVDVNDRDAVVAGQSLVTVVDLSAFEIEVRIPEAYADEIGPGTPARIRHEGQELPGTVRGISPEVESGQVRGIVAFEGAGPTGLRQNQRVSTRLILESRKDVLQVDRGPFLDASGGRAAYVVEGDSAVLREIRVGATSVDAVEIESGLNEGERVVVSDTTAFGDAARVYLRR